jgi:peptidoglycan/LPS O-acetylase OafA/YrhL
LHEDRGVDSPLAKFAVFIVGIITTGVCAEIFYRLVDVPSQWLAKKTFTWLLC